MAHRQQFWPLAPQLRSQATVDYLREVPQRNCLDADLTTAPEGRMSDVCRAGFTAGENYPRELLMQCPKCGSDVWDNRSKKLAGGMKPNAPDFSCKNKDDCGWVQWPPKKGGSSIAAAPQIAPLPAPQPQPGPSSRDVLIQELFWDSFDAVLAGISKRKLVDAFKPEHLASLTATLFIQRSKG